LSDVNRIRVLHFFVELGRVSAPCFAEVEKRGCYQEVLNTFFTEDILLKLTAVELMEALGSYQSGQEFLSRQGLPQRLAGELTDPTNDTSVRICVTRLLGLVILHSPDAIGVLALSLDAPFPHTLAEMIASRDPSERLCALNAWANVCSHAGGLAFFLRWKDFMQSVLASAQATQQPVCQGAIACWTCVLQRWPHPDAPTNGSDSMDVDQQTTVGIDIAASAQLWDLAEKELLPAALKTLLGKPFPEVRVITWRLHAAFCQSRKAAQFQLASNEMHELLLDFSSETQSDARIAKHDYVSALVRHQDQLLGAFLGADVEKLLSELARQGPHWRPREEKALVADGAA
jgi:hypothetical protein